MEIGKVGNTGINGSTVESSKTKAVDDSFEKRLQSAFDKKDEKELKKVCKDFEGILLNMMYKQMKATVPKSELIPSDVGTDIFESMLDDKLMEESVKSNGTGLGETLYKQLSSRLQSTYKPVTKGA
jgi:peptidoglycan hydrolase FlgJ